MAMVKFTNEHTIVTAGSYNKCPFVEMNMKTGNNDIKVYSKIIMIVMLLSIHQFAADCGKIRNAYDISVDNFTFATLTYDNRGFNDTATTVDMTLDFPGMI